MSKVLRTPIFIASAIAGVLMYFLAYSSHFNNPFEFDDTHTIEENIWIRDLGNIPKFFTDATTTSNLPSNQAWRPGLSTLNAIDYALSGTEKPEPFWFHVHIFTGVLLSGILIFLVFLHLLKKSGSDDHSAAWWSLFGSVWFLVHTANAETINYIISRSDSASTFWILLTCVIYFYSEKGRKYGLYLITMITGFLIKEPALMLAPILLVYEWLYGDRNEKWKLRMAATFAVAAILFLISRKLTPDMWTSGQTDRLSYLMTQPFVIVHYVNNFFLPFNLAVDTDWGLITNPFDDRLLFGLLFISLLLFAAWRSSKNESTRPVTFGILWFLLALAPTSSLIPFAEVLNDHRVYFPYIGLVLTCITVLSLAVKNVKSSFGKKITSPRILSAMLFVFLCLHVYGTRQRCEVWSDPFLLWKDCAEKCPKNGRGLMNYGNQIMAKGREASSKGDPDLAMTYFNRADSVYQVALTHWPQYAYLYINVGACREWQGRATEAEFYYRKALEYRADNPECYESLADYLIRQNRAGEAVTYIQQGLKLSPAHMGLNRLQKIVESGNVLQGTLDAALATAQNDPTPENYLNLSLAYYNVSNFTESVKAAQKAIELRANYPEAYNNICAAYNAMGKYDEAIAAGEKAVELKPDYQLAKNNLAEARKRKESGGK